MNSPDPVALARHRDFGRDQASTHFARYPGAKFTVPALLELMREQMLPVAGDHGFGSRAVEPLIRTATAGFVRQWRALQRNSAAPPDADGRHDWPPSDEK
jgi:hypothetical protein